MGEGQESEVNLRSELLFVKHRLNDAFMNKKSIWTGLSIVAGALALGAADVKVDVAKLPPAAAIQKLKTFQIHSGLKVKAVTMNLIPCMSRPVGRTTSPSRS